MALVHGGGDGLIIKLQNGSKCKYFVSKKYLESAITATAQSGSVFYSVCSRTLWASVSPGVTAPMIGKGTDADLKNFVDTGRHMEDVAARLVALAVEHALVPFTQRTCIRNAIASYWCTAKHGADGVNYSLPNTQSLAEWVSSGGVGEEADPKCVVWVGDARKTRGMSLLSRIMDVNGPILLQESFLLKGFDPGRLLMVGTGLLSRDFSAIQPNNLMLAIEEALWLLITYNNLEPKFITNAIRMTIRNLTIVDIAHYREMGNLFWRTRTGKFGNPVVGQPMEQILHAAFQRHLTVDALESVGLEDEDLRLGVLSDLFRGTAFAPTADIAGLAPPINNPVDWRAAAMLGAMQSPSLGAIGGISIHTAVFDAALPPVVPNVPTPDRRVYNNVMDALSGRSGYHVFGYSQPLPPGAPTPVPPGGWALAAAVPPDLVLPVAIAQDGAWYEWIGGNDAGGQPYVMANDLRHYVVRTWMPTTPDNYLNGYVAPPAFLQTFDVNAEFRMGVRLNGAFPDIAGTSPGVVNYVAENSRGADPLDFLTEDGPRALGGLSVGQKSLAFTRGLAYVWDAANLGRTQNDAYMRWTHANHAGRELTTVPDELLLYVGGVRVRKFTEPCGGLWTLCYTDVRTTLEVRAGHEPLMEFLLNRSALASYIMKLRAAVEMTDQMNRVSNARISGCMEPYLWPEAVDARLAAARIDEALL